MSCVKLVFLGLVEMAATRSIVVDLNQGNKLNDKNYDVWRLVIFVLLSRNPSPARPSWQVRTETPGTPDRSH